jgi:uncharacterized 2Fe-2S/4Fe-4S cluster protein (DUF4445 family)
MKAQKEFEIQFQPLGKRVSVPEGASVLEAARQTGLDLNSACGGEGSCGQCQVVLLSGAAAPANSDEEFLIPQSDRQHGYRLACCIRVQDNLTVHLPKESLITGQRLQVESNLKTIPPDPLVHAYLAELDAPSLEDVRADLNRLKDALERQSQLRDLQARARVIQDLSPVLRENKWKVNVFIKDREILSICSPSQRALGLAVDIGTTKVVATLVDLQSGENLGTAGIPNPQLSYGEDVISRLSYVVRNIQGRQLMSGLIRQALNELLDELLHQAGAKREQVVEACLVGNTAMIHLLLGYPVRQLATAPYVAASSDAIDVPAEWLGLALAAGANVHIPPSIGGFVGADHVAMVLASDLDISDKVSLGIDIGTNTEISLRLPGSKVLHAVSCASGPAFEGAHIRDGMRAASGAIEKVRIYDNTVLLTTINQVPAVGICGSGILDTVAELYRNGYLNRNSRFQTTYSAVRVGEQGPEFLLVSADQSGSGRDIVITQKDVNEIVLAKGAIQAGMQILLEATGTRAEAVQEVIIAGAFGSFLNIHNAIEIGLFPLLPNAQYRQVGNAAALGAMWILISRSARERARQISRMTRYLELTTFPKFHRQFALAMLFPESVDA